MLNRFGDSGVEDAAAVNRFGDSVAAPIGGLSQDDRDAYMEQQGGGFRAPSDLQISAYNPTLADRTRNFIRPLTELIGKLATVPRGMPQIPHIPDVSSSFPMDGIIPAAAGIGNTVIDIANQSPTPVGAALALGGAPAKVAGALLSPVMAQHAADNLAPTLATLQDPNATTQQKVEAGVGEGAAALGAAAPLLGLRRGPMRQITDLGTVSPEIVTDQAPTKPLALPEALGKRVAEKTPEQAVKAIREEIKLIEDPAKKAKLVDIADRLDNQIAKRDTLVEQQQNVVDAQEAQVKILEDQQKAQQKAQDDQVKAQQNAQKFAIEQAKAQGQQVQAIMEAQTPPEPLQASKPMVLANSASQVAKNIEDNPESAQAQLNQITKSQQQQQAPAQPQPTAPAEAPAAPAQPVKLKTIPSNVGIEYLGKKSLAVDGVGPAVDQWQVQLPGEKRGLTLTSEQIRGFGYEPPETIVSAAIRTTDGKIVPGRIHAEAFNAAEDAGLKVGANADDEGFVTSNGRFVNRGDAMKLAKDAGQMLKQTKGKEQLFVEHLDNGVNVSGKGLTAEQIPASSTPNEQSQAAPAQEAPGTGGNATDTPPPDNLDNRRKAATRRQQRGSVGADTLGTVTGATASSVYGYLSTKKRDDETEEQFQARRIFRAIGFGLGGGLAGGSAIRLFGRTAAVRNAQTLTKIQNEAKGIDTVPQWYQKLRQTGPMVKFREAINNSRAIVKDMVGNAAQEGTEFDDRANPYAKGKVYAAKVAEAQRQAGVVMSDLQKGVVEAGKASGIGVDNFINRLNIWMEARHTPYYNQHLADLHAASGGAGAAPVGRLTNAEALQVLADAKTDGLEPVFNNLYGGYKGVITSIRDLMEDGGLITPETRKAWETKFPEYVPMNRILPDEDIDSAIIGHIGGGPGLSVLGSGVRKISGSDLDVSDIAGNLMANWTDAITRVQKNEVAKSAGYFFKNLEFDGTPYPGIEVRTPKVIGTAGDHPIFEQFKPDNMVSYMVKGKPNWIVFRDPRIATAFSNLNPESQNRLMRIIATPTRILSRAFTGYNLDFLAPNIVRDRQSAAWKALSQGDIGGALEQINPARIGGDPATVAQWISGKQTPDTQLFQQMMDAGGMPGGFASSTRQKSQDLVESLRRADTNKAAWTVQQTQKAFNFLSEISEGSTRFRAYKRALELGATSQEAAVQALNSSIDFNQKGTITPSLGAFYAFFNPSAQGGVTMAKNLLRSKDAAAVLLAGLVGLGAAVDVWNSGFDPMWKKRKALAYSRTNGVPLIYGTDPTTKELKYFTLPISQELRPVKAVADFALEMSNGDIKSGDNLQDELGRVGGAIVSASNPLGADPISNPLTTATPTVARPLLEIASNRDYAGRPIIPDRLHDSPLVQRQAQRKIESYDTRTGRMAIALSDMLKNQFNLEVSPEHMKYLVNSYGGGPARTVSSTINSTGGEATGFKASDLPVVGSFVRRATDEGQEKTTKLYKDTTQQLSDAKTQSELAMQQSKLFFAHTFDKLEPQQWAPFWRAADAQGLIPKDMTFRRQIINDLTDKIKGRGDVDKLVAQFSVENGERAAYYGSRKRDFKTEQEYLAYLQDQAKKKLLTAPMVPQIQRYLATQK